jgi:deazaflavin-dependent oxidoreductase (nitroreductase family)
MRFLRPFTMRFVNPLAKRFAGWLPGFALLTLTGRRTGHRYRIPINVFHRDGDYVFALTYGRDVDWVRNVLAAGGCDVQVRGRHMRLVEPTLVRDPARRLVPSPVRLGLRVLRVDDFLRMRPA